MAETSDKKEPDTSEIVELRETLERGDLLPAPKTWEELVRGMAMWLVLRWKDEDGEDRKCAYCGGRDWEYGNVVRLDSTQAWPPNPRVGHGSYPYFQLGCKSCGNTVLLNVLLIFEPQRPKPQP